MKKEILAIIPARGGSKGIPRKNIKKLAGKPLLAYTAKSALQSRYLSKVLLSTDDFEIAEIGKKLGLEVPFMRPKGLAKDNSPSLPVFQHVLKELESRDGYIPDIVVILQPTSPFRSSKHIDEAISLFLRNKVDSVVSIVEVPHNMNPYSVMELSNEGTLHPFLLSKENLNIRQMKPKFYARNGAAIYVCNRKNIIEDNSLFGTVSMAYIMNKIESIDIDTTFDWMIAECLLEKVKIID